MCSKQIILLPTLMISIVMIGKSQKIDSAATQKTKKNLIGIRAGINLSWINMDPSVNQAIQQNQVFGIGYTYMAHPHAGLSIELHKKGYGWDQVFTLDSLSSYSRDLEYLEMPILSTFVIGKRNLHLKFHVGPKIAYLLEDIETSELADSTARYYYGREIEDRFELGIGGGVSLSYDLPVGEIELNGLFTTSFSNLWQANEDFSQLYSQNQGFALTAAYWIRF